MLSTITTQHTTTVSQRQQQWTTTTNMINMTSIMSTMAMVTVTRLVFEGVVYELKKTVNQTGLD